MGFAWTGVGVETELCLQTKVETKAEKHDADDEAGEGGGFKLDEAKIRAKGKV